METVAIVLAFVALAAISGVVYLLIQRGVLGAEAAAAVESQRHADERRSAAEHDAETARALVATAEARLSAAGADVSRLTEALDAERRLAAQKLADADRLHTEKLAAIQQAHTHIESRLREFDQKMHDSFGRLAGDALKQSSQQFLALAEQKLTSKTAEAAADLDRRRDAVDRLVKPIAETLLKTEEKLQAMERDRANAYSGLTEQVRAMQSEGAALRTETGRLVKALREPHVRGRYGEIQLRRVAELAGLRSYCDFDEQTSSTADDGTVKRPDMIVTLPNGRQLIVDAKTNLKSYLDAMEATTPEEAEAHLVRFADAVMEQARKLSKKNYYSEYEGSAEITVMFVPGDQFVDAALSKRHDLLDFAASHNVILASPSSLIAMLRAVAVGFREVRIAEEANQLVELARTLHERISTALEHVVKLGKSLRGAVGDYNSFVGSYESRVQPKLRQFEASGIKGAKDLPALARVEDAPKVLSQPDLFPPGAPPPDAVETPSA